MLNQEDLSKLNDCPFIAKLRPSSEARFQYCAILYPHPRSENINILSRWVEGQSFPEASIYTYGKTDRRTFSWKSDFVKQLKTATI